MTPALRLGEATSLDLPVFEERVSLRQQVAHALRAAMVTGGMRPGVVYSAPALATDFGVSATPVREAMLDLAKEGLVEVVRNKGFRVTELSEQELDEITKIRALIEVPTIGEIARACDAERAPQVEALRSVAREIEALAVKKDLIGYVEADRRFHLGLLALSGNAHLVALVGELRARSRLFGLQRLAECGQLVHSAREHEQLVELVLTRQDRAAEALMRHHIRHVRGTWAGRDSAPEA
jgi:DNA-binding GntR family transcriptional regulator